jgi:hypothetical protein
VRGSLWFWGTAYAALSGVFWWIVGMILQIGVPMMLNDHPAVTRVTTILVVLLAIYVAVSLLFFRALAQSRNR